MICILFIQSFSQCCPSDINCTAKHCHMLPTSQHLVHHLQIKVTPSLRISEALFKCTLLLEITAACTAQPGPMLTKKYYYTQYACQLCKDLLAQDQMKYSLVRQAQKIICIGVFFYRLWPVFPTLGASSVSHPWCFLEMLSNKEFLIYITFLRLQKISLLV